MINKKSLLKKIIIAIIVIIVILLTWYANAEKHKSTRTAHATEVTSTTASTLPLKEKQRLAQLVKEKKLQEQILSNKLTLHKTKYYKVIEDE